MPVMVPSLERGRDTEERRGESVFCVIALWVDLTSSPPPVRRLSRQYCGSRYLRDTSLDDPSISTVTADADNDTGGPSLTHTSSPDRPMASGSPQLLSARARTGTECFRRT
jgi:hypothetical protein